MNETKSERIYTRVTPREKDKITSLAKKCGLSQAEYLRKRALGYSPKAVQPDAFYSFCAKLDDLCNISGGHVSDESEQKILRKPLNTAESISDHIPKIERMLETEFQMERDVLNGRTKTTYKSRNAR